MCPYYAGMLLLQNNKKDTTWPKGRGALTFNNSYMINFNHITLPNHSRVWIYQADRKLSADEQNIVLSNGKVFTSTWAAHGNELIAELNVALDYFIIIGLDEEVEAASGCSIDKSMRFVLDMQKELGINFTNRLISAIYIDQEVRLFSYDEVKNGLQNGIITPHTLVFDHTVQNLNDLKTSWLKPLKDTWLNKLLSPENVK